MLPGLAHFQYGTPVSAELSPVVADWSGSLPNFTTSFSVVNLTGAAPFTFLWSAPGAIIASGQGTATVNLTSASGNEVPDVTCTITGSNGQSLQLLGSVNAIGG